VRVQPFISDELTKLEVDVLQNIPAGMMLGPTKCSRITTHGETHTRISDKHLTPEHSLHKRRPR